MAAYGFNFRADSGAGISPLTDGAGETYVLHTDTSATTRNGITFQWSSASVDGRSRLTTGDARLAGMNFMPNSGEIYFSVTLPSTGAWTIRAAFGDGTSAQRQYVRFKEGTAAPFATIAGIASGANEFVDAGGTLRTSQSTWISSNASISHTFSSTDFRVYIGDPALGGDGSTTIAHLYIESAGAGPIVAAQGSYSITGQTSTSLKVARVLSAAQGSYSLSGQAATLTYEQPGVTIMPAAYGTYAITGSDGLAQRAMNAVYGTYTINGRNASLRGPGDVLQGNIQKTLSMAMSMGL